MTTRSFIKHSLFHVGHISKKFECINPFKDTLNQAERISNGGRHGVSIEFR